MKYLAFKMENPISQRIKIIIARECDGVVLQFANKLDNISHQIITRLFKKDVRNGNYPTPSTEIILAIANKFTSYNPTWLLTGDGEMLREMETSTIAETEAPPIKTIDWEDKYLKIVEKHENLNDRYIALLEKLVKNI